MRLSALSHPQGSNFLDEGLALFEDVVSGGGLTPSPATSRAIEQRRSAVVANGHRGLLYPSSAVDHDYAVAGFANPGLQPHK
jgi:hypothetical protein